MRRAMLLLLVLATCLAHAATEIRFWAVTGSVDDAAMYRELAKRFQAKTGIRVQVTPLNWGNFATKYFTAMAAGLPPDIGQTNLGGPYDYGAVGGLVDLRKEFPAETAQLESGYYPGLLRMFEVEGALYGVPNDLSTALMFYRTDVFARLGIREPGTWSELDEAIRRLEAQGFRVFFGFPSRAQWALHTWTMPYGLTGTSDAPDGSIRVNWTEPKYQQGVRQAMEFWHLHDSPQGEQGSRVIGMFKDDAAGSGVPLLLDIHSIYNSLQILAPELEGKWRVAPFPKADDGKPHNVMGGTALVIFRKSKHPREAMQWMLYLNSLEALEYMLRHRMNRGDASNLAIPPNRAIWETSQVWRDPLFKPVLALRDVMREVVPTFQTFAPRHGSAEFGRSEQNLMDRVGTQVRNDLQATADRRGITIRRLVRDFARGQFADDRARIVRRLEEALSQGYAEAAPKAEALLNKEQARYQERYGSVITRLPEYERRADVMDLAKGVALAILALALGSVLAVGRLRKSLTSYLFVGTPLVLALVFVFVPAAVALVLSFSDYHPVLPLATARPVGTQNYTEAYAGGDLGWALSRTALYVLGTLPVGVVLALMVALLLNAGIRGERYWRFLVFSPLVTSVVSVSLIFTQLFLGSEQGWLNGLLLGLNVVKDPVPFLTSDTTFLQCVIVLAIWHGLAFTTLIFLAGLQQIPRELYEAAAVDGATTVRRHWAISLPGLQPQVLFVTVLGVIGGFQVFETIYMLARKSSDAGARFGPNDSGMTMVPLVYRTGFETFEMGKSSAIAYVLFALILVLTLVQLRLSRGKGASA